MASLIALGRLIRWRDKCHKYQSLRMARFASSSKPLALVDMASYVHRNNHESLNYRLVVALVDLKHPYSRFKYVLKKNRPFNLQLSAVRPVIQTQGLLKRPFLCSTTLSLHKNPKKIEKETKKSCYTPHVCIMNRHKKMRYIQHPAAVGMDPSPISDLVR